MSDLDMSLLSSEPEHSELYKLAKEFFQFRAETAINFSEVRRELTHHSDLIQELKLDVTGLKKDVRGLKEDVSQLKQDVSGLKQDVKDLKEDVSGLKQDMNSLKMDVISLKEGQMLTHNLLKQLLELKSPEG